jgi:hypothetical protein
LSDQKPLIERNEAFRRAERALEEFGSGSFFLDEKVGALLEALRYLCDVLGGKYRPLESPSAPTLWDQALAVAERLHAQRVVDEAARAEKCLEDLERRASQSPDGNDRP